MHEVLEELAILAIVVHACTAFPKPRRSSSHCSSEATGSGTLRSEAAVSYTHLRAHETDS